MKRGDPEHDSDRIADGAEACVRYREGEVHDVPLDDLARRRLIDELVARSESYQPSLSVPVSGYRRFGRGALLGAGFGGALAASVIVGLVFWAFGLLDTSSAVDARAPAPALETAELTAGTAVLETIEPILPGSAVEPERTFEAGDGGALLTLDPHVELLVERGSRLVLTPRKGAAPMVRLERGAVLAVVEPQQPATEFTIETAAGSATALGTVFAVFAGEPTSGVEVFEGAVAVATTVETAVLGSGRARGWGGDGEVEIDEGLQTLVLGAAERIRSSTVRSSATTLAELDQERLFDRAAGDEEPRADPPTEDREEVAVAASPDLVAPAPAAEPTNDLAGLNARIREAMRVRRWREAAELYQQLISRFPDSRQAQVAWVSLGSLQLGQLGQPRAALESFEQYLARSWTGPLAIEAGWGKARCLRRLGRNSAERVALEELIERYPYAFQSKEARQRLADLQRGADGP